MRVSILMAAYQADEFVGSAVRSVLAQTHEDWELLVVDDGSTDRTVEVVEGFGDGRISVLRRPHSGVLAQVRNDALAVACGDVVALLDADDEWLPRKLELQVAVLERDPRVGVVHTAVEGGSGPPHGGTVESLLTNNFVYSSTVAVRRSLLERHGAFDPDPALGGSPDYDLWLRLVPHTGFAYLPEPLARYRTHPGQMSRDRASMQQSALVALEKLAARDPELVRMHRAAFATAVGMRRQLAGEPGRGRADLLDALRRRPFYAPAWRWLVRSYVRADA